MSDSRFTATPIQATVISRGGPKALPRFLRDYTFSTLQPYLNPTEEVKIAQQGTTPETVMTSDYGDCESPDGSEMSFLIPYYTSVIWDEYGELTPLGPNPNDITRAMDTTPGNPLNLGRVLLDASSLTIPVTKIVIGAGMTGSLYGEYAAHGKNAPGTPSTSVNIPMHSVHIGDGMMFDATQGNTLGGQANGKAVDGATADPFSTSTPKESAPIEVHLLSDKNVHGLEFIDDASYADTKALAVKVDGTSVVFDAAGNLTAPGGGGAEPHPLVAEVDAAQGLVVLTPSAATLLPTMTAEAGSGVEPGVHGYVFAFANAADDREGICSAVGLITVTNGNGMVRVQVNTPDPTQASLTDYVRIYRTQADGSDFGFLTALAPGVFIYEDTTPDAGLDMTNIPIFDGNTVLGVLLRAQSAAPTSGPTSAAVLQGYAAAVYNTSGLAFDATLGGLYANIDNDTIVLNASGKLTASGGGSGGAEETSYGLKHGHAYAIQAGPTYAPNTTIVAGSVPLAIGVYQYCYAYSFGGPLSDPGPAVTVTATSGNQTGSTDVPALTSGEIAAGITNLVLCRTLVGGSTFYLEQFFSTAAHPGWTDVSSATDAFLTAEGPLTPSPTDTGVDDPGVAQTRLAWTDGSPRGGPDNPTNIPGQGFHKNISGLTYLGDERNTRGEDVGLSVYIDESTVYRDTAGRLAAARTLFDSRTSSDFGIDIGSIPTGPYDYDALVTLQVQIDHDSITFDGFGRLQANLPPIVPAIDQIDWGCGTVAGGLPSNWQASANIGMSGSDYNFVFGSPGNPWRFAGVTPVQGAGVNWEYQLQAQYAGQPAEWGPALLPSPVSAVAGDDHTIMRGVVAPAPPTATRYRIIRRENGGSWGVLREISLNGLGNFGTGQAQQQYVIITPTENIFLFGNDDDSGGRGTDTGGQFGDDTEIIRPLDTFVTDLDTITPPAGTTTLGVGAGSPWGFYDVMPQSALEDIGTTLPTAPPTNRVAANYDGTLTCKEGQLSLAPDQPSAVTFPEISAGVHNTGTPGQVSGTTITPNGVYTPHLEVTGAASIINAGTLRQRAITAPATPGASSGLLYSKTALGRTEPYWKDELGRESPILRATEWSILTDGIGNLIFMDGDVIAVATYL